jgi:2-haloalkanoic acid dehalogenase type II
MQPPVAVRAVCFDLLSALIDSWSVFEEVAAEAGAPGRGQEWRIAALRHVTASGAYQPYAALLADGAHEVGLPPQLAGDVIARWSQLQPWPEVPEMLDRLRDRGLPLATATNCPDELARMTAANLGDPFAVVVSAERAGFYKPDLRPYQLAIDELSISASEVLFVAGSAHDVPPARELGMPVVWVNRLNLPVPPTAQGALVLSDLSTLHDMIA